MGQLMIYMNNVLHTSNVPDDAGVAIEYQIPQTCKRIDFILTSQDAASDRHHHPTEAMVGSRVNK